MEIRPATCADIEAVERLNLQVFAQDSIGLMNHLSFEAQLQMRINLRQTNKDPVAGLLVAIVDDRLVGSVEVETKEMSPHNRWTHLCALRPLGRLQALRALLVWMVVAYRPAPHEAYLHSLAIEADYRRQGLAWQLMLAAEQQARLYGKTLTVSLISPDNKPSLALVERCGYQQVQRRFTVLHRLLKREREFVRVEKTLTGEQNSVGGLS